MFEYAVSAGEGTLLDYGVSENYLNGFCPDLPFYADYGGEVIFDDIKALTVIIGPASPDCTTGQ